MTSLALIARELNLDPELVELLVDNALGRGIALRIASLDVFTSDDGARRVSRELIAPTSLGAYFRMTRRQRRELLVAQLTEQRRASRRGRSTSRRRSGTRAEPAPASVAVNVLVAESTTPELVTTTLMSRAVVTCACGCGELFPASSWKPVVRLCEASQHRRRTALRERHAARRARAA